MCYYTSMIVVLLLGMGLIFGSFINALVWRLRTKRNWVSERSECTHCHHILASKDLIPVISWMMLKGKCRYCGHKIEDSPVTEVATSLLFAVSYIFWPVSLQGVGLFQFIWWLGVLIVFMALTVYDLRWLLLPNKLVYPLTIFVALGTLCLPLFFHYAWREVGVALLAAILLPGIFYILYAFSDGQWIGGGDVKLAVALGIIAGDPLRAILVLFLASVIGIAVSLPQIMQHRQRAMALKIPFGPFLIAGTILVQLFGASIIHWYTHLLIV